MPTASVIVPARDAELTLPRTLRALAGQDLDGGYEVIVVDDGSRDRTAELAAAAAAAAAGLRGRRVTAASRRSAPPPLATAASRRPARSMLAFCDADVFPAPGWLRAGIGALGDADLVQGCVRPDPEAPLGPFDRTLWITSQVGTVGDRQPVRDARGLRRGRRIRGVAAAPRAARRWPRTCGSDTARCVPGPGRRSVPTRSPITPCSPPVDRAMPPSARRLRYFPAMAARMPELRRAFLYRRLFLNQRTAKLDLALAAGALALAVPLRALLGGRRSPPRRPTLRELRRHAARAPEAPPGTAAVAAADVAADLVGLAALLAGSARYRAPVV